MHGICRGVQYRTQLPVRLSSACPCTTTSQTWTFSCYPPCVCQPSTTPSSVQGCFAHRRPAWTVPGEWHFVWHLQDRLLHATPALKSVIIPSLRAPDQTVLDAFVLIPHLPHSLHRGRMEYRSRFPQWPRRTSHPRQPEDRVPGGLVTYHWQVSHSINSTSYRNVCILTAEGVAMTVTVCSLRGGLRHVFLHCPHG